MGKDKQFTFDHVFGPNVSQNGLYRAAVLPLVGHCISGFNVTLLAYGQTGSGKTYTMGSGASSSVRGENMGILPRVVDELYTQLEAAAAERGSAKGKPYRVTCSLLEVYNEALRDLQTPMEHDATVGEAADGAGAPPEQPGGVPAGQVGRICERMARGVRGGRLRGVALKCRRYGGARPSADSSVVLPRLRDADQPG